MEFNISDESKENTELFLPKSTNENMVLYGTVNFYSFFRNFHCLYERIIKAMNLAERGLEEQLERNPKLQTAYKVLSNEKKESLINERYEQIFIRGLRSALRGDIDSTRYEDFCRYLLGSQSYLMFSIDKLVNSVFP